VDYRFLNALTIKGKFPIPVFDELKDGFTGLVGFLLWIWNRAIIMFG
jgi:hypothetical protein